MVGRNLHMRREYYFLAGVFLLLSLTIVFLAKPSVLFYLLAGGGNVTALNMTATEPANVWHGVYGSLTVSPGATDLMISGSGLSIVSIKYVGGCNDTEVYAVPNSSIDWSSLENASPAFLDSWLNISVSDYQSASNTFTQLVNFSVNGTNMTLYATYTNSPTQMFALGLLRQNQTPVFVSATDFNGTSFNGSPADFQFMLPVLNNKSLDYNLYTDQADDCASCSIPINITAQQPANKSHVLLKWTNGTRSESFRVYYIDDPKGADGFRRLNFTSATVVTNITATNWTDTTAGNISERYYRVGTYYNGQVCVSNQTFARYDYFMEPTWNMVSVPIAMESHYVYDVFYSINGSYSTVYLFNNTADGYRIYISPSLNTFNLTERGSVYWIAVNKNASWIIAGEVIPSMILEMEADYNLISFPPIDGNNSVPYVLDSINGSYSAIYHYNNTDDSYRIYINPVVNFFSTFDPLGGYWIKMNSNETFNFSYQFT